MPRGKGGQAGAQIAFSPDGKYLFLTVGDRQRMTPAQDPNQPVGKILRLTLDGKPAPGNPNFGRTGAATIPLIDPPRDTEAAKSAKVVSTYTFAPAPHTTPAESRPAAYARPMAWCFRPLANCGRSSIGQARRRRTEPDRARQELWLAAGLLRQNYNGVPIAKPDTRPDLAKPVIYWDPVIAPGNLMFYRGTKTFPQWDGNGFTSGLAGMLLSRIIFDGHGGAKAAERWMGAAASAMWQKAPTARCGCWKTPIPAP